MNYGLTKTKLVEIDGHVYRVTVCPPGAASGSDYFQAAQPWERSTFQGRVWCPDLQWYDRNLY